MSSILYLQIYPQTGRLPLVIPNSANNHLPHVARCGAGTCCPIGACQRLSKQRADHRAEGHPLRPPCGKPEICQLEILLRFIKRLDRFCFPFSALGSTRERGPPLSAAM
jgi:hypothetical protein